VKVSLPDAIDFCRMLGLPFFAGLTLVQSRQARAFMVDADPRFLPAGQEWLGRAEIALVRNADGACSNLHDLGGHPRCAVYAARPATCRLYPASWASDVAQGGPLLISCPVPFAITPSREAMFRQEIVRSIERWGLHDRVLEEWHGTDFEGRRTVDDFLRFAIPRTAELLGVSAEGIGLEPPPAERLQQAMLASKVLRPLTRGPRSPGSSD
jgi:Fe-S-cluster containining protein